MGRPRLTEAERALRLRLRREARLKAVLPKLMLVEGEAEGQWGPAMGALAPLQRRYVLAMLSDPLGTPTGWARAAGYSETKLDGVTKNRGATVVANHLSRMPEIMEAAREEARRHLDTVGPILGIGVMMQIARNNEHKRQLDAAIALADRTGGFGVKTEHKVTVEHVDDGRMLAIAEKIAQELGVERMKLIGGNVVEGKDVKPKENGKGEAMRDSAVAGDGSVW